MNKQKGYTVFKSVTKKAIITSAALVVFSSAVALAAVNVYQSQEADTATRAGGSVVSDTSASGSSAVKFVAAGACPTTKHTITAQQVSGNTNSGYPAGTQVYVPGSPDPWGGCFPNSDNTGIPTGTVLTNYTGSCNLTTPNTTITAKTINCSLTINAANVVIENSKINGGNITINGGSFILRDSEVNFGNNINDEGLKGVNFTVSRADLYGGKRQVWCNNNCTLEDSYLHDQLSDPTGVTHESAVRVEQNTTLRHNTLLCNAPDFPPDAGCSANQTGYPDFTTIHHNTMENNLYMATNGGYCSYGGATNGKPYSNDPQNATYIVSRNNVFQRGTRPNDRTTIALSDKRRYTCAYYGVTTAYNSSKVGFQFTGNMWDDGLLFSADTTFPYGSFVD